MTAIAQLQEKVEKASTQIRAKIGEKRQSIKTRKRALIFIWIFIVVMISALWTRYNQLAHGKGKHE